MNSQLIQLFSDPPLSLTHPSAEAALSTGRGHLDVAAVHTPVHHLPEELLIRIFSLLSTQELGRAAQVCRQWSAVQRDETIWKGQCLSFLNKPCPAPPYSWKQYRKILHSLQQGHCSRTAHQGDYPFPSETTFLEDGTALTLIPHPDGNETHTVRSPSRSRELNLNPTAAGAQTLRESSLRGDEWLVLDKQGDIFRFSLLTGSCQRITPQNRISGGKITCNGDEILAAEGSSLISWDPRTGSCTHRLFLHSTLAPEMIIRESTPNFILFGVHSLFALNKRDGTLHSWNISPIGSIAVSDTYVALLSSSSIYIFEEQSDTLALIHTISVSDQNFIACERKVPLRIYHNWLLVQVDNRVHIWNAKTGEKIAAIPHESKTPWNIYTNRTQLLTVDLILERGLLKARHTLYDFVPQKEGLLNKIQQWIKSLNPF